MAELRETHVIFGPFLDWDPLDTALLFLRTNGYSVVASEMGPIPPQLERVPAPSSEPQDAGDEPRDESENESENESEHESQPDEPSDQADGDLAEDEGESELPDDLQTREVVRPDEVYLTVRGERGSKSAGWFSSNLTELATSLELELRENKIDVRYTVTTTGQHLWAEEKEFWKREASALEKYLKSDSAIPNLVEKERERALDVRKEFARMGIFIGLLVGLFVFVFLLAILG